MNINKSYQSALDYYRKGNFQQAELLCRKIISKKSEHVDALYLLGMVSYHLANYNAAVDYITRALKLNPYNAAAYANLGKAHEEMGQLDEALSCYEKAIKIKPDLALVYNNIGSILQKKGNIDEAAAYYQTALTVDPNLAIAYCNMGSIFLGKRETDNAIHAYRKAVQLNPNLFNAYYDLGNALKDKGEFDEAISMYQKAVQLQPNFAQAYNNMGYVLEGKGRIDEAIIMYRQAIDLQPSNAITYNNLGIAYQKKGYLDDAVSCYRSAIQLDPRCAEAYNNFGNALKDKGELPDAEECFDMALQIQPDYPVAFSNLLLIMNYEERYSPDAIFSRHKAFSAYFEKPWISQQYFYLNQSSSDRKLRIGYVSPDFRRHSVAYFIEPVLAAHARNDFEVFCYSDVAAPDEVTGRLQGYADEWHSILGQSDQDVAELIRLHQIDILIDLAGHTAGNRMLVFARRPAPVQVSWMGYPATTGLMNIQYKLVDNYTDPPGVSEKFYTEELVRLPDGFLCYQPYERSPEVGDLPALSTGHVTFGSFNYFAKMSSETFAAWISILRQAPSSRLILKSSSFSDRTTCSDLMGIFTGAGISEKRIDLRSWEPSVQAHLSLYNHIDIGLDTFPYHGTTTTCEALWMGVPVVTLAGDTHVSRVGVSILSNIGLQDFIAATKDEYVEVALRLAQDVERLHTLRNNLRQMMRSSPLTDAKTFTKNLEDCYRQLWKRWCRSA